MDSLFVCPHSVLLPLPSSPLNTWVRLCVHAHACVCVCGCRNTQIPVSGVSSSSGSIFVRLGFRYLCVGLAVCA